MKKLCKFSILRYVPSEIREEFINIGLVFHCPEEKYVDFKCTTNFKRVTTFDDEIDIDFLKMVISGIEEDFTQSTINGPTIEEVIDEFFLEKNTVFYANQLQFSPIKIIRSSNPLKDFKDLFKTYVYFDVKKSERISDNKVKSIMNRVFEQSNKINKFERNRVFNIKSEEIILDYSYVSKNKSTKFIKTLSFDYSPSKSKMATVTAKEWAWNFRKIEEASSQNSRISKDDLLTLVYVKNKDSNIDTALKILNENSNIFSVNNENRIKEFANTIIHDID